LKKWIRQDHIQAGEILWQGPRVGVLIALSATKRTLKEPLRVLYLQSKPSSPIEEKPGEAYWSKDGKEFLIPLKALLDKDVVPSSELFGDKERKELANFIKELAQGFQFIS